MSSDFGSDKSFRDDYSRKVAELKARSKDLSSLVVEEIFRVEGVVGNSKTTSITPVSELIAGGYKHEYPGGFVSSLVLDVQPRNQIPVRKLIFNGFSVVRSGDLISARIPRYTSKTVFGVYHDADDRTFYLEREFLPEENAIELKIMSEDARILRTDRSVEYGRF